MEEKDMLRITNNLKSRRNIQITFDGGDAVILGGYKGYLEFPLEAESRANKLNIQLNESRNRLANVGVSSNGECICRIKKKKIQNSDNKVQFEWNVKVEIPPKSGPVSGYEPTKINITVGEDERDNSSEEEA